MATDDQVNQVSDGAILTRGHAAEVDKRAIAEADLHAVGALDVVSGHHAPKEVALPANGPRAGKAQGKSVVATAKACAEELGGGLESQERGEASDARPLLSSKPPKTLSTAEQPANQGCQPASHYIRLALRNLGTSRQLPRFCHNGMQPPLGLAGLGADTGLSRHIVPAVVWEESDSAGSIGEPA